ncbi:MAG TPA: M60 family metallopeptidase, partial [Phycisphaerales bacterium]|nr:M60 family metallopeptidase [Phycisphaerales bacterium]
MFGNGRRLAGIVLGMLILAAQSHAHADDQRGTDMLENDLATLTQGVKTIAAPGVPGAVAIWGKGTFCVVAAGDAGEQVPVVAAGRMGNGRFVLFPHSAFSDASVTDTGDTAQFLENVVKWTAHVSTNRAVKVGVMGGTIAEFLTKRGFDAQEMRSWPREKLQTIDVVWCSKVDLSKTEIEALRDFMQAGGGFVGAQTPWGWQQITGRDMDENGMNALIAPAGAAWTSGMTHATVSGGMFAVDETMRPLLQGSNALDVLEKGEGAAPEQEEQQSATTVMQVMLAMIEDRGEFQSRLKKLAESRGASVIASAESPLTVKQGLQRVLLAYEIEQAKHANVNAVKAQASAAKFPGLPESHATRVQRNVKVDGDVPGWASTGVYAEPGQKIVVELPNMPGTNEMQVQIGTHTDELWDKPEWRRAPEIVERWPIKSTRTEAASAFGGLVYIVVPEHCNAGEMKVRISGAIESPLFVLGETSKADWMQRVRDRPGPWAELATKKVILTVPSKCIRQLDDPESLMKFWDQILDAAADLAQIDHDRLRPERYCMDVQISAGYMHSG